MRHLLFVLALACCPTVAFAACPRSGSNLNPDTGGIADMNLCIAAAGDGDTINIPAGTYTYSGDAGVSTNALYWAAPPNVTIKGAGIGSTIIVDNHDRSSYDGGMWNITTNGSGTFRLTGFTLRLTGTATSNGSLRLGGTSQQFRMDNVYIDNVPHFSVLIVSTLSGVIDHNTFDTSSSSASSAFKIFGTDNVAWSSQPDLEPATSFSSKTTRILG